MRKKTLLYYETADKIREYIISEKLQQGAFLPPERILAEEFKVSVVTLKNALKFLCEENILKTVPRRGTKVNEMPSAVLPQVRRKKRIGITVWKNADVFHTDNIRLIEAAGDIFPSEAYEIVIVYVGPEMIYSESWGSALPENLDGIFVTVQELPPSMLQEIKNSALPAVFMELEGFTPGVWINETPGISKLMNYLNSLGHSKIAFISGPHALAMVQEQLKVFRSFAVHDERYIAAAPYERKAAFTETLKMLELPEPPTAILLGNEFMAQGALDALQAKGLKCPDDVSIACFGGISLSLQSYPQLTILTSVFNQPSIFKIGAQMLCDIIENRNTETSVVIERELVVRESTALKNRV